MNTVEVTSSPRVSIQVHSQELIFDKSHVQPRRRPVHQKLGRKLPMLDSEEKQHESRHFLSESARGLNFKNTTSSQNIDDDAKDQFKGLQ